MKNPVLMKPVVSGHDFYELGENLGYNFNDVVDEIQKYGMYGMDGDEGYTVYKYDSWDSDMLNNIIGKIFEMNPSINEFMLIS